jgi:hypothetical protein
LARFVLRLLKYQINYGGICMKKFITIFMAAFLFSTIPISIARAVSYNGSITSSSGGGLWANGGWDSGGAILSWNVNDEMSGLWTYSYTFTVDEKAPSHAIIEVSDNFDLRNIKIGTTTPVSLNIYEDNGNPGLPGPMNGLKWDDPSLFGNTTVSWQIVTDRNPMWGDFYSKDGQCNDDIGFVIAYNTGFGINTDSVIGDGNAGGWVLVPDTIPKNPTPTPEPATVALLSFGLIGLGFVKRS